MDKNRITDIIIYQIHKGSEIEVWVEKETIWLTQAQIGQLYDTERSVITKHLGNIFKSKELVEKSNVQKLHITNSDKAVKFYNLECIISVGYRVNSRRATQFRIWATRTLKEFLVKGYVLNEKKLGVEIKQLKELYKTISLIGNVAKYKELKGEEAKGILKVLSNYTEALDLLDKYDYQKLEIKDNKKKGIYKLTYKEAKRIIEEMKVMVESTELFGKEKDDSLKSSLYTIYQTFDKKDLYPSIKEKTSNLLYMLVKNHSFFDGTKRIAASLFIWFMHKNNSLFDKHGVRIIDNNMLVALTLMVAESRPIDKEMMIKVIANLIQETR